MLLTFDVIYCKSMFKDCFFTAFKLNGTFVKIFSTLQNKYE